MKPNRIMVLVVALFLVIVAFVILRMNFDSDYASAANAIATHQAEILITITP